MNARRRGQSPPLSVVVVVVPRCGRCSYWRSRAWRDARRGQYTPSDGLALDCRAPKENRCPADRARRPTRAAYARGPTRRHHAVTIIAAVDASRGSRSSPTPRSNIPGPLPARIGTRQGDRVFDVVSHRDQPQLCLTRCCISSDRHQNMLDWPAFVRKLLGAMIVRWASRRRQR
jgi:hypothetical protein